MILNIKKGAPVVVNFDALADQSFEATITEVGVAAGATAYPVTVQLNQPAPAVRAGMAANVEVTLVASEEMAERLFVPAHAVMEDDKGRFAYVAEGEPGAEGTIKRRQVTTGELTTNGLEVKEGLRPGDRVVVAGLRSIEPESRVRIAAE